MWLKQELSYGKIKSIVEMVMQNSHLIKHLML